VPESGQEIEGFGGFRLKLVQVDDEELLEMEATYPGDSPLPPEHLHPSQTERFEVLEGAVQTVVGGKERRYEKGESFEVPAGTPHQMTGDGPARINWQVRPALRTAEFFERLYGTGPGSASEMGESFLEEFAPEFRLSQT
jgi:mannose-6-phosphate isomerase-like protein (cupin superfamily)